MRNISNSNHQLYSKLTILSNSTVHNKGAGAEDQIFLKFNYKVNFKDFYTKLCVCSRKKKTDFKCHMGHVLGMGLGVLVGQKLIPSVCLLLMLSTPKPLDEIQIKFGVCVTHMYGACSSTLPLFWGPGEGSKSQISLNFNFKVNFKDLYTKLCTCSHK